MPSPKRWFPVDQDINHKPKMRELMKLYGLGGLRVWLEILSISDRAGEYVDCTSHAALSRLSSAAETRMKHASGTVEWLHTHGSLAHDDAHMPLSRVVNYWKYHKTRETHKSLTGGNLSPSPPNLPNLPNTPIAPFLVWWCRRYEELFQTAYHLRIGKEANLVAQLQKSYPPEQLKLYAEEFFRSTDDFTVKAGFTLPVFASQINKIVGRLRLSAGAMSAPKDMPK